MRCSKGHDNASVIDTRPSGPNEIRRRRKCDTCGERFTTYERKHRRAPSALGAVDLALIDKGGLKAKYLEQQYERSLDTLDKYDDNGILISKKPAQHVRKVWL